MPKITDLSAAAALDGTEEMPAHQSTSTVKATLSAIRTWISANLAASGVTAATYGDSTHVGQFTVGADGRITAASSVAISGAGGGGTTIHGVADGRLTLSSGVPVTTSDVTGATSIYWTPFRGNQVGLYNGTSWDVITFAETSIALGTLTSGKNYDVFAYNNAGTLALEFSAAWTNDTTRADALALQDGVYVKSADHTRRYLGTFRTTSTTTTEDSRGGTSSQTGGKRFLWNCYNRQPRPMAVIDTTSSWSYTTTSWRQADGASGNKIEYVCGLDEEAVDATLVAGETSSSATNPRIGIGYDSTTSPSTFYVAPNTTNSVQFVSVPMRRNAGLGYHFVAWLEYGGPTSCTFWGSFTSQAQTGLSARING